MAADQGAGHREVREDFRVASLFQAELAASQNIFYPIGRVHLMRF